MLPISIAAPQKQRARPLLDCVRRPIVSEPFSSGVTIAIEVSFFINEDALTNLEPEADLNEAGFLAAFDAHRSSIVAVAARKYVRNSKHSYELIGADFRG